MVTASGTNNLQLMWWIDNKSMASRYTVSCSIVSNMNIVIKKNVTFVVEGTINMANIGQLLPSTRYNCCVIEYNVDGTFSEVCKVAVTQVGEQTNSSFASGATISLFAMILIMLLCISVLLLIIRKQGEDGKRIVNW